MTNILTFCHVIIEAEANIKIIIRPINGRETKETDNHNLNIHRKWQSVSGLYSRRHIEVLNL